MDSAPPPRPPRRVLAVACLAATFASAAPPLAATTAPLDSRSLAVTSTPADAHTSIPGMAALAGNANLLASGIPPVPAPLKARLGQYLNARAANLVDVSPNGESILISTRFANTAQLHLVTQPGGDRQQLTFFDEPVANGSFIDTPAGDRFKPESAPLVFLQDVGGGEAYQIYGLQRATGRSVLLTDGKSRHGSLTISRDSRHAAFSSNARNGKDMDVYVVDSPTTKGILQITPDVSWTTFARRLTAETGNWSPGPFSPDGTSVLAVQYRAIDDADLHLLNVATDKRTRLTPTNGKGSVAEAAFSADGRSVYFVTDRYSDFNELYRIDLAAGIAFDADAPESAPKPLTRSIKWGVEHIAVSPSGETVALSVNQDGISRIYLLETATGKLKSARLPEPGVVGTLMYPRDGGGVLYLSADTARGPSDVYSMTGTNSFLRWTRSEVGGLDSSRFAKSELVRYPSTDGVTVPAFLYRPTDATTAAARKLPVLVVWHGGPEGQSRPNFSPFVQFLVNELGIAVLMPNVRGSDGYGKANLAMDDGVKRERSLDDIGATLDWIATRPDLDPKKVAVYGGSYGGYMVLATAAFQPDRIKAAVDVVGVSSIASFLQNTQPYRRDLRRQEYGDERDPAIRAVQDRISPLNAVDRIKCALFVQQGKNDPRVPQSEAEQIVKAVRAARGGDPAACWYLLALDEGHGFAKKANRDQALMATILFLQEHLLQD